MEISVEDDPQVAAEILSLVGPVASSQSAEELSTAGIEGEFHAGAILETRSGINQVLAGDVEDVVDNQDLGEFIAAPGPRASGDLGFAGKAENVILFALFDGDPPSQQPVVGTSYFLAVTSLGRFDLRLVILAIGQDAEFQRPGAGDLLLNTREVFLFGLGYDDLDLVGPVRADRHL